MITTGPMTASIYIRTQTNGLLRSVIQAMRCAGPGGHAGPGATGASRAGHADNMRAKIDLGARWTLKVSMPEPQNKWLQQLA